MIIRTEELTGAALNWAVAIAEGYEPDRPQDGQIKRGKEFRLVSPDAYSPYRYSPSTDWEHGGPLRDKYHIDVMDFFEDDDPYISAAYTKGDGLHSVDGPTALIAICRAVVACKLGDQVEVPDELVCQAVQHD